MSDIEKVYSRAVELGSATPIQLRWEGSGDSVHAATLLLDLQQRVYPGTTQRIKYYAAINIYEKSDSAIVEKAFANLELTQANWVDGQDYDVWTDIDVTRNSRSIEGQPEAHIMFVRNIMLTDNDGNSRTGETAGLLALHSTAIRQRSNSFSADGGALRLGMSGSPGLAKGEAKRDAAPVKHLFRDFSALQNAARSSGFALSGNPNRKGAVDFDRGEVMKNDGRSLGIKNTYYLTYVK